MHNVNNPRELIHVAGDVLRAFTYATCFYIIYAFSFVQVHARKTHKLLKASLPYYNDVSERMSNIITKALALPYISSKLSNNNIQSLTDTFNGGEYTICIEWINNTPGNFKYNPDVYQDKEEILRELTRHMGVDCEPTLFIYNVLAETGSCDKLIVRDFQEMKWNETLISYVKLAPLFMSIQVVFENDHTKTAHNIALHTNEYNYYVSGNVINSNFIMYYCKHVLGIEDKQVTSPLCYSLTLVDTNINVFTICEKDEIVFAEDTYVVKYHPINPIREENRENLPLIVETIPEPIEEDLVIDMPEKVVEVIATKSPANTLEEPIEKEESTEKENKVGEEVIEPEVTAVASQEDNYDMVD